MKEKMSEVIEELSKIETEALEIINDIETRQKSFALEVEAKKNEFDKELNEKTDKKLEVIGLELERMQENDLKFLKKEAQENLLKLESSYQKNHSLWAKEVLDSIVKE